MPTPNNTKILHTNSHNHKLKKRRRKLEKHIKNFPVPLQHTYVTSNLSLTRALLLIMQKFSTSVCFFIDSSILNVSVNKVLHKCRLIASIFLMKILSIVLWHQRTLRGHRRMSVVLKMEREKSCVRWMNVKKKSYR